MVALALALCQLATAAADEAVFGNIRIQALSPTVLRVEPRGPQGFENRSTFMVTSRAASPRGPGGPGGPTGPLRTPSRTPWNPPQIGKVPLETRPHQCRDLWLDCETYSCSLGYRPR